MSSLLNFQASRNQASRTTSTAQLESNPSVLDATPTRSGSVAGSAFGSSNPGGPTASDSTASQAGSTQAGPPAQSVTSVRRSLTRDADAAGLDAEVLQQIKRQKVFANQVCDKMGLEKDELAEFATLTDPAEKMIYMFGYMVRTNRKEKVNKMDALLVSSAFKINVTMRLWYAITSPDLEAYVTNLLSRVTKLMKRRPDIFDINPEMFTDPKRCKALLPIIGQWLIDRRSAMRQKIQGSIAANQPISVLTAAASHSGAVPTLAQWTRFSALRAWFKEYTALFAPAVAASAGSDPEPEQEDEHGWMQGEELDNNEEMSPPVYTPPQRTYGRGEFWDYADQQLLNLRDMAKAIHPMDKAARAAFCTSYFTGVIRDDLILYPEETGADDEDEAPLALGPTEKWKQVMMQSSGWNTA